MSDEFEDSLKSSIGHCQDHANSCIKDAVLWCKLRIFLSCLMAACLLAVACTCFYETQISAGVSLCLLAMIGAASVWQSCTGIVELNREYKKKWSALKKQVESLLKDHVSERGFES